MLNYYEVQQGGVTVISLSPEGSKRASKALEDADPWGSIPLVYFRSCDDTRALMATLESNSLKMGKLIAEALA
jgi:ABC-type sugar transport system substrate-binding protein